MAVAKMKKVTIFASREKRERVFELLRDLGVMQVTRVAAGPSGRPDRFSGPADFSAESSKLSYLRDYFLKCNPARKSFIDMFTGKKPEIDLATIYELAWSYDVGQVYQQVKYHEETLKHIADELSAISGEIETLTPWVSLDIAPGQVGATAKTESFLATVPLAALPELEAKMAGLPAHCGKVWEARSLAGVWVVGLRGAATTPSSLVVGAGGSVIGTKGSSVGLVPDIVKDLERRAAELSSEKDAIVAADKALSQDILSVLALIDYYLDKKNLGEVEGATRKTQCTVVIEGYVKAKDVARLRGAFDSLAEAGVVDEDPDGSEEVPIYLENHPIIRPFEVITNIYGYPRYDEIDPTPFLAPFFWLFFGICLGDGIYGIVLSLGTWYFLKTQKLGEGGQKLVKLLMYGGLASILAGALTASWMSDLATAFFPGSGLERAVNGMAVINPVTDPLTMLAISFAFGIFQVWVGIGVKMLGFVRHGQLLEGVLSCGSWMVFLPGVIAWAVSKTGLFPSSIPFYIMLTGALMVVYSTSRGQKNIFLKPFAGLYGLYGTMSYFADTMSYSRLLALGLASAVIGMVINKIAILTASMIPIVGWVFVPIILIVGHLFNLVISVLGSFIHSGRLQFVEFFTKFFEGGGKPFKPLTRVTENVSISD